MLSTVDKASIIKVFTVVSAVILFFHSLSMLFEMANYTSEIVCLYLLFLSLLILIAMTSPLLLENYVEKIFPFFGQQLGRICIYIIASSFCYGEEMGLSGKIVGVLMILCAAGAFYMYAFAPVIPPVPPTQYYSEPIDE